MKDAGKQIVYKLAPKFKLYKNAKVWEQLQPNSINKAYFFCLLTDQNTSERGKYLSE